MNHRIHSALKEETVQRKKAVFARYWLICWLLCQGTGYAQRPLDEKRYKTIADSAIRFFASKQELCYRFEERWSSSNSKTPIRSSGDVKVLRHQGDMYYRGSHHYVFDSLGTSSYDFVKNPDYFGVNVYSGDYFKDYKEMRKEKRFFGLNANEKDLLKPDSFLYANFSDARFLKKVSDYGDHYRLELIDTNRHVYKGAADGYRFQNVRIYDISKKDYSLKAFTIQSSSFIENALTFGEATRNFTLYTESRNAIKDFIFSFKPLAKKNTKKQMSAAEQTKKKFPAGNLINATGEITSLKKQVSLVHFWYSACASCVSDFNYLKGLQRQGLDVVAINVSDSASNPRVKQLMNKYPFTFLFGGSDLATRLNVTAFPTLFLIDEKHSILYRHTGAGGSNELMDLLEMKLKPTSP